MRGRTRSATWGPNQAAAMASFPRYRPCPDASALLSSPYTLAKPEGKVGQRPGCARRLRHRPRRGRQHDQTREGRSPHYSATGTV
jgi:hypothetical protein